MAKPFERASTTLSVGWPVRPGSVLAHRLGEDPDVRTLRCWKPAARTARRSSTIPLTWGLILKHRLVELGLFYRTGARNGRPAHRIARVAKVVGRRLHVDQRHGPMPAAWLRITTIGPMDLGLADWVL